MQILVTGATGYLGSEIVKAIIKQEGIQIWVTHRPHSDLSRLVKYPCKFLSITQDNYWADTLARRIGKLDAVIHCATSYGHEDLQLSRLIEVNLGFSSGILDLAIKCQATRFINADTMLEPSVSPYALSKAQFRDWLKLQSRRIRIDNLRIEHFYGPFDRDSKFCSYVVRTLLQNKDELILTSGTQKRDFIFISDVVSAFEKILVDSEVKECGYFEYELGTGNSIEVRQFVDCAKLASGNTVTKLNYGKVPFRPNEPACVSCDNTQLLKLGWKPKFDYISGLEQMIRLEKQNIGKI